MTKTNSFNLDKATEPESQKKKLPYPKSIIFIIGNEFCERFSFYGMRTILVLYLKFVLSYPENIATQVYHIFAMACYFTPVLGAVLADSLLGKYWTILIISCIYAVGNIILSFSSIHGIAWLSFLGLALIALGTGGIKPCVSAFGGDQFLPGQERQLQQFFSLFYISINSGSLISTFLTPILRQDIPCMGRPDCYPLAFGVPAILMVVALLLFILGKFTTGYIIYPPQKDGIVGKVFSCVGRALRRKFTSSSEVSKKAHWLDYADDKFDKKTVKDVKALMRVLFLYLPLPIFWALFDQQGSRWTLQAIRMNGRLGNITVKPDQIQFINPLLVVLFIPVFDYVIYPLMNKVGLNKPLKRMVIGGLLASVSFGVCGFFQGRIEAEAPVKMMSGHNHLAIINGGPMDISPFQNELIKPDEIKIFANIQRNILEESFAQSNLTDGQSLIVYYREANQSNIFIFENFLSKPKEIGSKMFTLLDIDNYNGEVFSISSVEHSLTPYFVANISDTGKIGYLEPFEIKVVDKDVHLSINTTETKNYVYPEKFGQGATYIQVIRGDLKSKKELKFLVKQVVEENKLSIFFQLFQYLIITSAEIMFSVTGLEFSYSQAPKSMKSVLQAAWLMTVAFGNLIVAVIADLKIFEKQSHEFYFFGTLMLIDIIIFAIMAYSYVPFKNIDNDEDETNGSSVERSTISLEPIQSKTTTTST